MRALGVPTCHPGVLAGVLPSPRYMLGFEGPLLEDPAFERVSRPGTLQGVHTIKTWFERPACKKPLPDQLAPLIHLEEAFYFLRLCIDTDTDDVLWATLFLDRNRARQHFLTYNTLPHSRLLQALWYNLATVYCFSTSAVGAPGLVDFPNLPMASPAWAKSCDHPLVTCVVGDGNCVEVLVAKLFPGTSPCTSGSSLMWFQTLCARQGGVLFHTDPVAAFQFMLTHCVGDSATASHTTQGLVRIPALRTTLVLVNPEALEERVRDLVTVWPHATIKILRSFQDYKELGWKSLPTYDFLIISHTCLEANWMRAHLVDTYGHLDPKLAKWAWSEFQALPPPMLPSSGPTRDDTTTSAQADDILEDVVGLDSTAKDILALQTNGKKPLPLALFTFRTILMPDLSTFQSHGSADCVALSCQRLWISASYGVPMHAATELMFAHAQGQSHVSSSDATTSFELTRALTAEGMCRAAILPGTRVDSSVFSQFVWFV